MAAVSVGLASNRSSTCSMIGALCTPQTSCGPVVTPPVPPPAPAPPACSGDEPRLKTSPLQPATASAQHSGPQLLARRALRASWAARAIRLFLSRSAALRDGLQPRHVRAVREARD